ncbi:tRNA uracil 4-sulfurtransferase ThiI [Methanochimaera problematica]|nr:tRNA uracil 4-sulfurtransferase ThiI [Methanoplanus sp. FWC-SCC4]
MARYGEIFLKSDSVQRHYIKIISKNIRNALLAQNLEHELEIHRGRILINGNNPEYIAETVSKVFGIVSVSIAIRTESSREEIENTAAEIASLKLKPGMSFAVRARRSNVKGFTSQELGASTGDRIYDKVKDLKVDLKNPDYEIFVEARREGGLIYDSKIEGPGGLPLGTQGAVLSLMSAGIDSPVASWLAMKRGCTASFVNFSGGRYMGGDILKASLENLANLSKWTKGQPLKLYVMNIEPFYDALMKVENPRNRCLICKRFMLRVASKTAKKYKYLGLVMGNNIGQVASQTLVNMAVVESVIPSDLPLIQPLITYDKEETVVLARKIGTFRDFAGDVSCSVVPKHPAVAATIEKVLEDEKNIDIENLVEICSKDFVLYKALNGEIITD